MTDAAACPLCGGDRAAEIACSRHYTGGWPVHVCGGCGLVYVIDRRPSSEIAAVWSEELFGDSPDPRSVLYQPTLPAVLARLTYVVAFVDQGTPLMGKSLCDIGAGTGVFLALAAARGAEVFGVEPSAANCAAIHRLGFTCHHGIVESYVPDRPFDVVAILWTLDRKSVV